ncbi:MAG: hypothetical protein GF390_01475 [Candidatus Pacebacteria bacterium]|nr:hypothetical protein [Candidatus Paceibacterota bacterium]
MINLTTKHSYLFDLGLIGFSASPLLLELVTYQGLVGNKIKISALALSLSILIIIKLLTQAINYQLQSKLLLIVGTILLLAAIGWGIVEAQHYANYVFSQYHFQFPTLISLSGIFLVAGGLFLKKKTWLKHAKPLIFWSGWLVFLFGVAAWFCPDGWFFEIVKEGNRIENLQFATLLLTLILGLQAILRTIKNHKIKPGLKSIYLAVLVTFALGCVFLAGEEVAWGQHWFHYEIKSIQSQNRQQEITLHNSPLMANAIFNLYILIATYGTFSWLLPWLVKKLSSKNLNKYFVFFTEWYTMPYFLVLLLFQAQQKHFDAGELIRHWGEYTELMLYLGFFWIAWRNKKVLQ